MGIQEQLKNQPEAEKKLCLASRIVGVAWISALSLLLVVGLFLRAPWKITTLIFIFLAAATILPRVYRKWFWAGIGVIAAGLIIWVFLPEDSKGWRPYTFDKELAILEAKYAIPDRENAAIVYDQLLKEYDESTFESNLIGPDYGDCIVKEPWSSKECPEAARWLEQQEGTITKLIEASKIENCRFPISADFSHVDDTIHRLIPMEQWALLLIWAANNDIAEGQTENGLEKYSSALQMGKQLNQQSSLLDFLVGAGIERNSISQFKRFAVLGDATEKRLNFIEKALAEIKYDWSHDFLRFLEHEKLLAKNSWGKFYEVNPEGKIRLTRCFANVMRKQLPQDVKDKFVITYWRERLMRLSTIWAWFYMPSTPQQAGAIIDAVYERYYAMTEPDFDRQKAPRKFSIIPINLNYRYMIEMQIRILEPAYRNIHNMYLRTMAQQRGGRLIVALRRYKNKNGSWPDSLDEVKSSASEEIFVDPTNDSSFVYRKFTNEDFVLYSKGKNNIDDNSRYESDDWPIWPPSSNLR
jgi:hypothetical protein